MLFYLNEIPIAVHYSFRLVLFVIDTDFLIYIQKVSEV